MEIPWSIPQEITWSIKLGPLKCRIAEQAFKFLAKLLRDMTLIVAGLGLYMLKRRSSYVQQTVGSLSNITH